MRLYSVQATIEKRNEDGTVALLSIPTFYLDPRVQGIVSTAHAEKIAKSILNPTKSENLTVHPNAVMVNVK